MSDAQPSATPRTEGATRRDVSRSTSRLTHEALTSVLSEVGDTRCGARHRLKMVRACSDSAPPPLAANGRILLRTKAELGHEAGEIKVLVNFCDLSALELEHPGHLHAEGVARRRDCLSAGTEQRSLVRPRAGGL